jgi:hypothetical protein
MENEKTNEEEQQSPSEDSQRGNSIDEAKELLEKITEQNKIGQDNIQRLEALKATEILGGSSNAGQEPVKKSKDDEITEAAKKLIGGSGYEDELFN